MSLASLCIISLRVIIPWTFEVTKPPSRSATSAKADLVQRIAATTSHTESPSDTTTNRAEGLFLWPLPVWRAEELARISPVTIPETDPVPPVTTTTEFVCAGDLVSLLRPKDLLMGIHDARPAPSVYLDRAISASRPAPAQKLQYWSEARFGNNFAQFTE